MIAAIFLAHVNLSQASTGSMESISYRSIRICQHSQL